MSRSNRAVIALVALATCFALRAPAEERPNLWHETNDGGKFITFEIASESEPTAITSGGVPSPEPGPYVQVPPEQFAPGQGHVPLEALPPTPTELLWFHKFKRPWFQHRHPADPERHMGMGEPLHGTSWRNRPLYVSLFAGGLLGDELQEELVDQGGGFVGGIRFGGDFDHYWGIETRLALADLHVNYPADVSSGKASNTYFDASLLYYPWGDSRWRPYFTAGLGIAGYKYQDAAAQEIRASAIAIPWGGGVKYMLTRHVAVRLDLIDNFSLSSGSKADTMHNFSFTGGVEIHFGGRGTLYSW